MTAAAPEGGVVDRCDAEALALAEGALAITKMKRGLVGGSISTFNCKSGDRADILIAHDIPNGPLLLNGTRAGTMLGAKDETALRNLLNARQAARVQS